MKRPKAPQQPNYVRKLHYLWRIGAIPRTVGLHQVTISHDGWCGIYQDKRCNCDPEVRLKWSLPAGSEN